eukprot:TRINITY_DN2751_c0_g1_i3.p1 TRINITY_DN2751_c0_g1~~TRINITY_DN2751_c0_g1_i3.p1  ORF type:complete len:169 (-),score=25.89 TRINITY_DN2751_c0_g1_i3:312-818(-)
MSSPPQHSPRAGWTPEQVIESYKDELAKKDIQINKLQTDGNKLFHEHTELQKKNKELEDQNTELDIKNRELRVRIGNLELANGNVEGVIALKQKIHCLEIDVESYDSYIVDMVSLCMSMNPATYLRLQDERHNPQNARRVKKSIARRKVGRSSSQLKHSSGVQKANLT